MSPLDASAAYQCKRAQDLSSWAHKDTRNTSPVLKDGRCQGNAASNREPRVVRKAAVAKKEENASSSLLPQGWNLINGSGNWLERGVSLRQATQSFSVSLKGTLCRKALRSNISFFWLFSCGRITFANVLLVFSFLVSAWCLIGIFGGKLVGGERGSRRPHWSQTTPLTAAECATDSAV